MRIIRSGPERAGLLLVLLKVKTPHSVFVRVVLIVAPVSVSLPVPLPVTVSTTVSGISRLSTCTPHW